MKFFVPDAKDERDAEKFLSDLKQKAEQNIQRSISDRRVYRCFYLHNEKPINACVGQKLELNDETVIVILETAAPTIYLIFTASRGLLLDNGPVFVGENDVLSLEFFE